MDIKNYREEYEDHGISIDDVGKDPLDLFDVWFKEACEKKLSEPNAFTLSTVSPEGYPRSRTMLLKDYEPEGFVFFTNYESLKGQHIAKNPQVCLLFTWLPLHKQVLIIGEASKITETENHSYFTSRPRGSQIGAWASNQSQVVPSRRSLDTKFANFAKEFGDNEIKLPPYWGGYRVFPKAYEFWSGRKNRLHDRFQFTRKDNSNQWDICRLSP